MSYRRSDTSPSATALRQLLLDAFGRDLVFQDVTDIDAGEPFPDVLREELARAQVVLVLIGSGWLAAKDVYERRRIDDPNDWVHVEVATAVATDGLMVIPVLVDDTVMPTADALPEPLKVLAARQAVRLRHAAWESDAAPLLVRLAALTGASMHAGFDRDVNVDQVWCGRIPRRPLRFVGRAELLAQLPVGGDPQGAVLSVRALTGQGGVGKTTVATEYAWRKRDELDLVWWVRADQSLTLVGDLAELADTVGRGGRADPLEDPEERAGRVVSWLEHTSKRWLVVFDDADRPQFLERWVPRTGGGQVIITSRYADWTALAEPFLVGLLARSDAIGFLVQRVAAVNPVAAGEIDAIAQVVDRVDGLPLALEQAGAYVARHEGRSFAGYLKLFDDAKGNPFPDGTRPLGYQATAYTTWQVSITRPASRRRWPMTGSTSPLRRLRSCAHSAASVHPDSHVYGVVYARREPPALQVLDVSSHRRGVASSTTFENTTAPSVSSFAYRMHQPGVSRHLRVLRDAGLVDVRIDAQRRIYHLRTQPRATRRNHRLAAVERSVEPARRSRTASRAPEPAPDESSP